MGRLELAIDSDDAALAKRLLLAMLENGVPLHEESALIAAARWTAQREVRSLAVQALGNCGVRAARFVDALRALLDHHSDEAFGAKIMRALLRIGGAKAVPTSTVFRHSKHAWVRAEARRALRILESEH